MPPAADAKPGGEEDCKVCKKGKQSTAAFGALLAQRGMAIPGAGTNKQTGTLLLNTVFAPQFRAERAPLSSGRWHLITTADGVPVAHKFKPRSGLPGRQRGPWPRWVDCLAHDGKHSQQPIPLHLGLRFASSYCLLFIAAGCVLPSSAELRAAGWHECFLAAVRKLLPVPTLRRGLSGRRGRHCL